MTWTPVPRLQLYADGRHQLATAGNLIQPDYAGAGAALQVKPGVSLEARERWVMPSDGSGDFSVTNLGVRAQVTGATEVWSSYQLAGADGRYNSALVGLSNRPQGRAGLGAQRHGRAPDGTRQRGDHRPVTRGAVSSGRRRLLGDGTRRRVPADRCAVPHYGPWRDTRWKPAVLTVADTRRRCFGQSLARAALPAGVHVEGAGSGRRLTDRVASTTRSGDWRSGPFGATGSTC